MNLKENRSVLIGAAVALALWGLAYLIFVAGNWERADAELAKHAQIAKLATKYFKPGGTPLGDLERAAREEEGAVRAAIEELKAVQFVLGGRFKPSQTRKKIYFQEQLDVVYRQATRLDIVQKGAAVQLGFDKKLQERTGTAELLQRLAVLDRIIRAATPPRKESRIKKLVAVSHPERVREGHPDIDRHVLKVPVEIEIQCDEKALIHLMHDLLKRPGKAYSYVGLDRLEIRVTEPESGVFTSKLSLFGMFLQEGPLEQTDGGGLPPLPMY